MPDVASHVVERAALVSAHEARLESALAPLKARVHEHPLYGRVTGSQQLQWLMRSHVFCVWDFQSLLKSLQRRLTCVDVPWFPSGDPNARRLINEIVLEEESDEAPWGGYCSHFELYLRAMAQVGSDTGPIDSWIATARGASSMGSALTGASLPPGVADFLRHTASVIERGDTVAIAATFTYGREDIIPEMFERLVRELRARDGGRWSLFSSYLTRHIECDGERHGPMSRELVRRLCNDDPDRWATATVAAALALEARLSLWDAILAGL